MLDKSISINGQNNIVVNDVKDSMINIVQNDSAAKALKGLYDVIINEANTFDTYVIYILNRGGISWYEVAENRIELFQSIEAVNVYIDDNRFYFSDETYVEVCAYFSLAKDLRNSLDCLVQAIATADDQDAITGVYDITYEQDIHCDAKFVRYMMMEFYQVDKHPVYNDFANLYERHEVSRNKILAAIQQKREIAI